MRSIDNSINPPGGRGDAAALNAFDARVADRILLDVGMSDALDRQIHVVTLRRAAVQAAETALQ